MENSPVINKPEQRSSSMGRTLIAFLSPPAFLFGSGMLIALVLGLTGGSIDDLVKLFDGDERLANVVISCVVYISCLILLLGLFRRYIFGSDSIGSILGSNRRFQVRHIGYTLLAFGGYFLASTAMVFLAQQLIPGFDLEQAQETGHTQPVTLAQYAVTFIGLVVVPPILEELIFRGYMFGGLRKQLRFWPAAILTSVAFGVVHGQWNVGVDTFVLSIFLCALREKTDSIWPCILLHAAKNGLAFYLLFVYLPNSEEITSGMTLLSGLQ